MRTWKEIREAKEIKELKTSGDGGHGIIRIGGWAGSVIFSDGGGWDHVSVSPFNHGITPTWDDMCRIKEIFFKDSETVVEYHPAKDNYVNLMPNCLHLWKPQDKELPLPPTIFV